jgi:FKBP-type peptidyl-prolyl cis-trans isomerase FkpA
MKSLRAALLAMNFALAFAAAPAFAADGLGKTDTLVGKGKEAVAGKTVEVHYTGWLYEPAAPKQHGKQFDSSVGRGPFSFPLGAGRVIKGWDEGVAGMKVGGKRTLVIPPGLAYGKRGAGGVIPPDATLVFDVELLDVK